MAFREDHKSDRFHRRAQHNNDDPDVLVARDTAHLEPLLYHNPLLRALVTVDGKRWDLEQRTNASVDSRHRDRSMFRYRLKPCAVIADIIVDGGILAVAGCACEPSGRYLS